jgi:hypothetical protein
MIKIRNGDLFSHFFALRFSLTYKSHVKGRKGVQHKKEGLWPVVTFECFQSISI